MVKESVKSKFHSIQPKWAFLQDIIYTVKEIMNNVWRCFWTYTSNSELFSISTSIPLSSFLPLELHPPHTPCACARARGVASSSTRTHVELWTRSAYINRVSWKLDLTQWINLASTVNIVQLDRDNLDTWLQLQNRYEDSSKSTIPQDEAPGKGTCNCIMHSTVACCQSIPVCYSLGNHKYIFCTK